MSISDNIYQIKKGLPPNVKLVVISKTKSPDEIMEAYNTGHKAFGENKVQELISKYETLPKDIEWHMIGHLQTNKVKIITPFVHLIHSVDSLHLLNEINKQGAKHNRVINCLLQVYIASEETKFGLNEAELTELIPSVKSGQLSNIKIKGLMGMASFTSNINTLETEFKRLFDIFASLKNDVFTNNIDFTELSMGMSSDYQIAVEQGSTMVRIGSKIFGERNYNSTK